MGHKIYLSAVVFMVSVAALTFGAGEQETPDDGTIHVALSAPITGDWSEYGVNFQRSVEMAIEKINADGGVLDGRTFRLSVGDTRGNPQEAAT